MKYTLPTCWQHLNKNPILAADCRWQSPRSRKRSWDGSPKKQDHLMHYSPLPYTKCWGCRYCCLENSSRRADSASWTPAATRSRSNYITTSSGWHVKGCQSQRFTSYHTAQMASKDLTVESWQRSSAPPFTTSSASFTTNHRSAKSRLDRTSRPPRRRAQSRRNPTTAKRESHQVDHQQVKAKGAKERLYYAIPYPR